MKFCKMNTYITNTWVKKWNFSWPFRGLYVPHLQPLPFPKEIIILGLPRWSSS